MFIDYLRIINFRNFEDKEFIFKNGINILIGKNGVGKTTVAEAISYCATLKSFRTSKDKEVINHNSDFATIISNINSEFPYKLKINFLKNSARKVFINDTQLERLSDFFCNFVVISFTPDDLRFIKDGPKIRRRQFDITISQLDKDYFLLLQRYMKILNSKNKTLKSEKIDKRLIDVYNKRLIELSSYISLKRSNFFNLIKSKIINIINDISENKETVELYYSNELKSIDDYKEYYEKESIKLYDRELLYKTTLFGAHKEDFIFKLNGKDSKKFASQGQQRTIIIAIKFAILDILKNYYNITPVFILDDVLSELDHFRVDYILNKLENSYQTILTSIDIKNYFNRYSSANIIEL